jgi:hypothetical protein
MPTYQGSTVVKRRPKDGEQGIQGPLMVQKEWVQGDTHRYTDEVREYFYVRGADAAQSYWYTLVNKGTVIADAPPTGGADVAGYQAVQWLKELSVQFFIAEEANLANLIFKDQKLISLRGTVNGVAADYSGQANFEPNIIIDGKNGKITAIDATIRGTIDAVSGYLGNLTIKENGYIKLPPTWMEGKYGVINNNGIEMVYSGYNSQSINWNVGVFGEYAGKISTNVNGRLQLSSTFGIGLGLEYLESISDAITITYGEGFHHNVNFNTSILSNIRELNQLGLLKFVYNTYTLYSGTIYSLGSDTTLMVLTYVGSDAQIFRLTTTGSTPLNGEVRIIVNAGTNRVIFNKNHVDQYGNQSNLKIPSGYGGGNFELHEGSCVFLVYYGGYWLLQVDRGQ